MNTKSALLVLLLTSLGTGSLWAGKNAWTTIGPFGGSARSLAIHPHTSSTIYVGTSGGVFKTTNGGASWNIANSGLPAGYIAHSLVIDPQNSDTVYVGGACGTYGQCGVFKSTNGGVSWRPINSGLDGSVIVVESLAIDPQNPDTLYAGTSACFQPSGSPVFVAGGDNLCFRPGVFKTTNGGATWTAVSAGLPWASVTFGSVGALAIDPQNTGTVYAGTAGGVFKTTNGGVSWSATASSLPCCYSATALVIDRQNPSTLYAAGRGIFKTTNGGADWNLMDTGLSSDCCASLAIDPQNPNTLYAGGPYGILTTTDGGAHWSAANPVLAGMADASRASNSGNSPLGLAVDPQNPGTVYAATGGLGVFKSTDAATNWNAMNSGLSASEVTASAVDSQNPGTIYAAANTGLFKTTDGGVNWSPANSGLPAGGVVGSMAIDPKTPSTVYAGISGNLGYSGNGPAAGIFKSVDGGANWISISPTLEPGLFTASLAIDPHDSRTIYAGGFSPNHSPGFVGEILKSVDGGASWKPFGFPSWVRRVVIDPQGPDNVYAVAVNRVFKSADGGASWMDLGVPIDSIGDCDECLAVGVLAVDPQLPDTVYAGGYVGVLKSTDGGATWKTANSGLPWPPKTFDGVGALVIDPHNSNNLYATMDGQVFRSTDGGATWTAVDSSGLTATFVGTLAIEPKNPNTVYAGTAGGGMFAITFAPHVKHGPPR
jgi:photosystem II stability/assembly factor-like uncharacterized protein